MNATTVPTPRLGLHLRNFDGAPNAEFGRLIQIAQAADRSGIDFVVVSDHVVFGEFLDDYGRPDVGGISGGRQPTGPDGAWLEPLTLLSFIAGSTNRVRLATHVLLAALRRPVVLAKTLATLDVLSAGRLDVGVGVGWQAAEYRAAGLEFEARGRLLDETLETCRALWAGGSAEIEMAGLRVSGLHQMPSPVQPGGVPLWISGRLNARVVSRLARFGSGWIPWGDEAASLASSVPAMRRLVEQAGGDPSTIRVTGAVSNVLDAAGAVDVAATMSTVPSLIAAGVTDFVARVPLATNDGIRDLADIERALRFWTETFADAAR